MEGLDITRYTYYMIPMMKAYIHKIYIYTLHDQGF